MIEDLLKQRILLLDGATGTLFQRHRLEEADYRGDRFRDHPIEVPVRLMVVDAEKEV